MVSFLIWNLAQQKSQSEFGIQKNICNDKVRKLYRINLYLNNSMLKDIGFWY